MKRIFLLLLLVSTTLNLKAQDSIIKKKWSFGIELFPNRIIENGYPVLENSKFSLNGFFKIYYKLNNEISISTGIGYCNIGERKSFAYSDYRESNSSSFIEWSKTNNNYWNTINTFSSHHNIQIPFQFRKTYKSGFFFNSGISGIINFSNEILLVGRSNRFKQDENIYRVFNFSLQLGVGYEFFRNNNNLNLYIQPTIEKYGLPIEKFETRKTAPLSYGLVIGTRF